MLTNERAKAIWAKREIQNRVDHLVTREEDAHVRKVWRHMPGDCSWMDAFFLLLKEPSPDLKFQRGAFVRVAATHGSEAFRGRIGMVRDYVPFGKYHVYLLDPTSSPTASEFQLHLVDGSDLIERTREYVRLTGRVVEAGNWGRPDEIKPGDVAHDDLYWSWLEAVPPATHKRELMQMGEPMDSQGPNAAQRFLTLQKHGAQWIYTGVRPRGELVDIEK